MLNKQKKPKDGWFFTRSLLEEITKVAGLEQETNESEKSEKSESAEAFIEPEQKEKIPGDQLMKKPHSSSEKMDQEEAGAEQPPLQINEKERIVVNEELEKLRTENTQLKDQREELTQINNDFLKKQKSFTTATQRLMSQKEKLIKDNARLQEENKVLQRETDQLTEKLTASFQEKETIVSNHQKEITLLKEALHRKQSDDGDEVLKAEMKQTKEKLHEIENYVMQLSKEKKELLKQNELLMMQMEKITKEVHPGLEKETDEEQMDKEALSEALYHAHSELVNQQQEIEKGRKYAEKISSLEQEVNYQKERYSELNERFLQLSRESSKLHEINEEKEQLKAKLEALEEETAMLVKNYHENLLLGNKKGIFHSRKESLS